MMPLPHKETVKFRLSDRNTNIETLNMQTAMLFYDIIADELDDCRLFIELRCVFKTSSYLIFD